MKKRCVGEENRLNTPKSNTTRVLTSFHWPESRTHRHVAEAAELTPAPETRSRIPGYFMLSLPSFLFYTTNVTNQCCAHPQPSQLRGLSRGCHVRLDIRYVFSRSPQVTLAIQNNLNGTFSAEDDPFVMRVEDWSIAGPSARGRDRVRISSQSTYDEVILCSVSGTYLPAVLPGPTFGL
jgi:hypothetical protein